VSLYCFMIPNEVDGRLLGMFRTTMRLPFHRVRPNITTAGI